jgi:hypothetical protein
VRSEVNHPGGSTQESTPWGVFTLPHGISPEQFSEVLEQLKPPVGGNSINQVFQAEIRVDREEEMFLQWVKITHQWEMKAHQWATQVVPPRISQEWDKTLLEILLSKSSNSGDVDLKLSNSFLTHQFH